MLTARLIKELSIVENGAPNNNHINNLRQSQRRYAVSQSVSERPHAVLLFTQPNLTSEAVKVRPTASSALNNCHLRLSGTKRNFGKYEIHNRRSNETKLYLKSNIIILK